MLRGCIRAGVECSLLTETDMTTIELKIDGMTCGHCVAAVKRALEAVDGVSVSSVAIGAASFEVDEQVLSDERAMAAATSAVAEEGYSVSRSYPIADL